MGLVHLALNSEFACYYCCNSDTCRDRLLTGVEQAFTDVSSLVCLYHMNLREVIPKAQVASLRAIHKGLVDKIQTVVGSGAVGCDCQAICAGLLPKVSTSEPELCPQIGVDADFI